MTNREATGEERLPGAARSIGHKRSRRPGPLRIASSLVIPLLFGGLAGSTGCSLRESLDPRLDPASISKASGLQGTFNADTSVFRYALQRPGLATKVAGVTVTPAMGLTAWATLSGTRQHAILLGDIPLREEEVNGALKLALEAGLVATSLHNTFLLDSPRIMSLHIEATGSEEALSKAMGKLFGDLSANRIELENPRPDSPAPRKGSLDAKTLESLLWKGEMSDGVYRLSLGRGTTLAGQDLGESTGVSTWAAFSGDEEHAVVNGDVATIENELPYVLKALIESRIRIVSIHSHMTQEKPKLVFVHFFGMGKLPELARGVKEAFWLKEHFQSQ